MRNSEGGMRIINCLLNFNKFEVKFASNKNNSKWEKLIPPDDYVTDDFRYKNNLGFYHSLMAINEQRFSAQWLQDVSVSN